MDVTSTRIIETCLDGSMNIEKTLDHPTDQKFIYHLACLGQLEYFSDFPRPFFRITRPGVFIIKGVEGERTFGMSIFQATANPDSEITAVIRGFRHS